MERSRSRWMVPAVVLTLAAVVRLWGLGHPRDTIWDERYYAFDAYSYLGGTPERGDAPGLVKIEGERSWEHPPLGKIVIALGVGPLGFHPWGYRLPPALFGIAGVGLIYLLGLLLWGSPWWAGLAAIFAALDGEHLVHSRVAMLDGIQSTFLLAAVVCFVLARRASTAADADDDDGTEPDDAASWRWLRWAGALFGAAVATKWSSAFVLGAAVGAATVLWRGRHLARIAVALAAIPVAVYVASYGQFFAQHGPDIPAFVTLQERMLTRQHANQKVNPERSSPWQWPLQLRPIRYSPPRQEAGTPRSEVLELGNPILWWGFLGLAPIVLWAALRRRSWADAVVMAPFLLLFVPWFGFGRTKYSYYIAVCAPWVALSAVAALRRLPRPAAWVFGAAVIVAGLAFLPLWIDQPLPAWSSHLRWLSTWI